MRRATSLVLWACGMIAAAAASAQVTPTPGAAARVAAADDAPPAATGTSWALTEQLAPLAPVKSYCSILSGFENKIPPITHHEGMAGMWSGHPYISQGGLNSRFGGPSIDQVAAELFRCITR